MIGLGCLYPCPELVRAQLARGDGDPKRILDLGKRYMIKKFNNRLNFRQHRLRHGCLVS